MRPRAGGSPAAPRWRSARRRAGPPPAQPRGRLGSLHGAHCIQDTPAERSTRMARCRGARHPTGSGSPSGRAPSRTSPAPRAPGGTARRRCHPGAEDGAQLGTLAALRHRELVRADAGAALDALRASPDDLDDDARAMLRLATRERDRALRVPETLVREITEACSRCVSAWVEAREADDFAAYAGPLPPRRGAQAPRPRRWGSATSLRRPARPVRAGRRPRPRAGLRRPPRAAGADRRGASQRETAGLPRAIGPRRARWRSPTTSPPWSGSTRRPG